MELRFHWLAGANPYEVGGMSPVLATQAPETILLVPNATTNHYGLLGATLVFLGMFFYVLWIRRREKRNLWHLQTRQAGLLIAVLICFVAVREFRLFYGIRILPHQVELLYIWPKDPVLIDTTELLDGELKSRVSRHKKEWRLWVWTRDGQYHESLEFQDADGETGQRALRWIKAAVIWP